MVIPTSVRGQHWMFAIRYHQRAIEISSTGFGLNARAILLCQICVAFCRAVVVLRNVWLSWPHLPRPI